MREGERGTLCIRIDDCVHALELLPTAVPLCSGNSLKATGVVALVPTLAGLVRLDVVDLGFAPGPSSGQGVVLRATSQF